MPIMAAHSPWEWVDELWGRIDAPFIRNDAVRIAETWIEHSVIIDDYLSTHELAAAWDGM